jgi:hypothetical protein
MLKNRPPSKIPLVGPDGYENVVRIPTNTIDSGHTLHASNASLRSRLLSTGVRQDGIAEVDSDEAGSGRGSPAWLKVPKGIAVGVALAIPLWTVLAVLVFWLLRVIGDPPHLQAHRMPPSVRPEMPAFGAHAD